MSRLNVERAFALCRLHTSFLFKKMLWGLRGVFNSECAVSWCCYCSVQLPGSTLQPAKFFKRFQRTLFTWFTKSGNWGWVLLINRPLARWRHISTTTRIPQSFAVLFFSLVQSKCKWKCKCKWPITWDISFAVFINEFSTVKRLIWRLSGTPRLGAAKRFQKYCLLKKLMEPVIRC